MQVKALLCVQRGGLSAITALSELRVINPDGICSDEYHEVAESLLGIRLCALWGSPASVPFIGDLVLQRFQKSELDGVGPETLQPGNFELLWSQSLTKEADSVVYLFSRQQPQAHLVPDTPGSSKRPLQARSSKKTSLSFKILQLADLHFTGDSNTRCSDPPVGMKPTTCTEALMQSFIHDLLVAEQPDLVVFSGDNVHTSSIELHKAAVDAFTSGVEAMGIPFAIVFGNHDHENGFDKLEILKLVMNKAQSYTERGPTELPGLGNYELAIVAPMDGPWGPKGSEVFRLYLLDSHSNPNVTADPNALPTDYDWIRPQQVEFYRQRAELHRSQNGSLPSVMFFHVPIPEFAAAASKQRYGEHQEAVSSPHVNTNLFSTLVEQNDVKAVFVGHDHLNEYCYLREGIQLCYGGGTGLGRAYGDENFARRARVIEWTMDAKQQRTLTTWKRHFGSVHSVRNVQVLFTEDPSLASSSVMMEWYVFLPAIVTFVCISLLCGRHCWHKRRRQQKKMRDTAMHMVVATD
ncbi:hypothetical protein Poli38472_010962 [Pythium oligandrum]|uniref:Calcineurin-like phosphoesterase domain-containing protein n=1 Tax=Pythium oligandrum TaxID=41045 RepID=A0A8K1CED3_PYTOL|nr:hypothetical protein Poli38472_010962 [Pythium oligandrum]|eukprot:TMW61899.1 hypothetical protein Poli38472_010962 [Pythium oligandrum]